MITDSLRSQIYETLDEHYPLARAGAVQPTHGTLPPTVRVPRAPSLGRRLREELIALQEQVKSQLLYQLHTFFEFPVEDGIVQSAVEEELKRLDAADRACAHGGSYDAATYAYFSMRKAWHDAAGANGAGSRRSDSLLSGLFHVRQSGFFSKSRHEIASWTRWFLLVERYHRFDALEHENRLDRYRSLRGRTPIRDFNDLLIWLEYRFLEESSGPEIPLGLLSIQLARELDGRLSAHLLPVSALQPALYVLLRCYQFCLAETVDSAEQRRYEQILATRQFDSVLDLMRVVVQRSVHQHRLPGVEEVLDDLRSEGFNIEHQGFRDPYEADLVPLEDTERLESCRLPVFLTPETLSGDFPRDLQRSHQWLRDLQRRTVQELVHELECHQLALLQPLPRAHMMHRLVRLAVTWALARHPWPPSGNAQALVDGARELVPEGAVKHLVRPRKGYEIKARQELVRLIEEECRRQSEALQRIALSRRIQGLHDYTQFARYLMLHHIQEYSMREPAAGTLPRPADLERVEEIEDPQWVSAFAQKWSIDARRAHPQSLDAIRDYLHEASPPARILGLLGKDFVASENEQKRIYGGLIEQTVPVFYRLVVAQGRHQAGRQRLPSSPQWQQELPLLVGFLVPPLPALEQMAFANLREEAKHRANSLLRQELRPLLFSGAEWLAYLAWALHQRYGKELDRFLDEGDLDSLLADLETAAANVDLPVSGLLQESVRSMLVELLRAGESGGEIPEDHLQELLALLPRLDCGACGKAGCREFARSLLLEHAEATACIHLAPADAAPLTAAGHRLRAAAGDAGREVSPLELLRDRGAWASSPLQESFRNVLSAENQKARRLFFEKVREIWERLTPKPQVFKCPDAETFYREMCRYLGYESTERLRRDEKTLLSKLGDKRLEGEWRLLKEHQDWLKSAHRSRQSAPLLRRLDPQWRAEEDYRNLFFLHQLSAADRALVLRYRLQEHQDGFSTWWNEDLITMNLPDFSIRDWEDFSKIIKNAYWHQESSLAAEDAVRVLMDRGEPQWGKPSPAGEAASPGLHGGILEHYLQAVVEREEAAITARSSLLDQFRKGRAVADVDELRTVVAALTDQEERRRMPAGTPAEDPAFVRLDLEELWEVFQGAGFLVSPQFSCRWDELSGQDQEAVARELGSDRTFLPGVDSGSPYLGSWDEPMRKRVALTRGLFHVCLRERLEEHEEGRWLERALRSDGSPRVPLGSLTAFMRFRLRRGASAEEVKANLGSVLKDRPGMHRWLEEQAVHEVVARRQLDLFRRTAQASLPPVAARTNTDDGLTRAFPEFSLALDRLLERHQTMDRKRLLHYLFLLAKMQGNLDALTALLREIRETSDVIEAAWLRFTEERLLEGPMPRILPGTTLGIPLQVSYLKEKDQANLCLREGVGRREKRNIAAAVNELLQFIRFHVLVLEDRQGSQAFDVVKDIREAGYDLTGIDDEALQAATAREWKRRSELRDQKIWIYSMVTARKLAAQHSELQEVERQFYKIRLEILKDGGSSDPQHDEIASRRGVALGQVKEEMYRQLSDLLESERIATFQKRIQQIVEQLDLKREEIYSAWLHGEINSRTVFYLLRQYQKRDEEASWEDFQRFLVDHWCVPLAELRGSTRPDRDERMRDLNDNFLALLGVSLLDLEGETKERARHELELWMEDQLRRVRGHHSDR